MLGNSYQTPPPPLNNQEAPTGLNFQHSMDPRMMKALAREKCRLPSGARPGLSVVWRSTGLGRSCPRGRPRLRRVRDADKTVNITFIPMGVSSSHPAPTTNGIPVGSGFTAGWSPVAWFRGKVQGRQAQNTSSRNSTTHALPSRKSILSRLSHRHHHCMIPVASCDFVFKKKKGTLPLCRVPAAKSISGAVTWTGPRQSRRTHFLGRRRRRVT